MSVNLDLDVDVPEKVPEVLRKAAEQFNDSWSELQSAWQDKYAGKVWYKFALILESAAEQCERAINKYV